MRTLVTPRLRLEPLVVAHADALYPMHCNAQHLAYLDQGAPASLEALRERYRLLESRRSGDGREHWLNWALVEHAGGPAVGVVQATVLDDGRAWVAYEVMPSQTGRGLASEAVGAMLPHLAQHYGVAHFLATVDRRNERSWRLLERLAFERASDTAAQALDVAPGDWRYQRSAVAQREAAGAGGGGAMPWR
jgi:[ribosomal protein S5]-alanine N-acetyltransferase